MSRKRGCNHKKSEPEKTNRISVADFEIESNVASLEELETCLNRVIAQNRDFAQARRTRVLAEHMGMIG